MAKGSVKEDILTEKQNLSILLGARPWFSIFYHILKVFRRVHGILSLFYIVLC